MQSEKGEGRRRTGWPVVASCSSALVECELALAWYGEVVRGCGQRLLLNSRATGQASGRYQQSAAGRTSGSKDNPPFPEPPSRAEIATPRALVRAHGTGFETMAILVKALKCATERLHASHDF